MPCAGPAFAFFSRQSLHECFHLHTRVVGASREKHCCTSATGLHLDGDGHDIGLLHTGSHSNKALEELRKKVFTNQAACRMEHNKTPNLHERDVAVDIGGVERAQLSVIERNGQVGLKTCEQ